MSEVVEEGGGRTMKITKQDIQNSCLKYNTIKTKTMTKTKTKTNTKTKIRTKAQKKTKTRTKTRIKTETKTKAKTMAKRHRDQDKRPTTNDNETKKT